MKLSVVIVNYNVKYFLEQCLRSLEQAAEGIEHEVIVVDNASTDGSTGYITSRFPNVRWVAGVVNHGFSRANNIAFGYAKGEYVLMLNPDTIVTASAIKGCIDFMDSHPDAGAAGVMMLNRNGDFAMESRRGIVTPWVSVCKGLGLNRLFPKSRLFGHYYMSYLPEDEANPIEMVSGACMFLRRRALEEVGYLDDRFFMYWEDSDLSYRILKSGYRNYYLPFPILHYKGESSIKSKLKYRYWLYSSLQIFFRKHNPFYFVVTYLPLKLVVALLKFRIHCINPLFLGKDWDVNPVEQARRFVVVADRANHDAVAAVLGRYGLPGDNVYVDNGNVCEVVENIRRVAKDCNFVLFDSSTVPYGKVIEILKNLRGFELKIATCSVDDNIIITAGMVFAGGGKNRGA